MSTNEKNPASNSKGKTQEKSEDKKNSGPLILLAVIVVILIIIYNLIPEKKESSGGKQQQQTVSSVTNQTFTTSTYPPIDPQTFEINGSFSEKKIIRDGYYVSFVCDQPYEIQKSNGALVKSEANKCANIGLLKAEESTENSNLKFRTLNDSTTTMTLNFTPMEIKKLKQP